MGKEDKREGVSEMEEPEKDDLETSDRDSETGGREIDRDPVEVLEEKLDEAKQEGAQSHDRFLRTAAEFENYKKRTTREMDALRKYANEALLKDLLSAVDNLERAIHSSNDSESTESSVFEGIDMTLKELLKILEKYQVKPVEAEGKTFDPAFHQAFMTEENEEHPENTVLREFQKGYTLHDRLLRPAMVVVSKAMSENSQDASAD
ncbi:MAG: nucleotide exchange factor GrpE [Deltaproteobacteria bacterium]|nr:nucleotide exchange factor GrpE [Deltaproteobacteria bacterium]